MSISLELPKFCLNENSFLKLTWIHNINETYEPKIQFFFSPRFKIYSSINLKCYKVSSFLFKVDIKADTNIIANVKMCFKINKLLKSTEFFDFKYLGSRNFNLKKIFHDPLSMNNPEKQLKVPIDLIPINFTQFSHFKNNFDLNKKNLYLKKDRKFHNLLISQKYGNDNPLGIDRRSIFSLNSKIKNGFDFSFDLTPIKPAKYFKKNLRLIPPFALGFLLRLYKHRPIWTKSSIENYLPIAIKRYLRKIFPLICYKFKGITPFKDTWLRYEFDPRKISNTSIYKTMTLKENLH